MKTTAGSSVFGRARLSLVKDGRANLGRFQLRPRTNILIHPLLGLDDEHDSLVHHSIRSPSHGRPLMDDGTYLLCLLHHQLWFSSPSYYYYSDDPPYCARQGSFIYCLSWLVFTILAFNYLCLVWVSLPTITSLLAIQPPPFTCADCTTPYYQTKKIILFTCLPWHSYLLRCGYSLLLSLMACT